jgi:CRISPR type I-D-associated protein Csc2
MNSLDMLKTFTMDIPQPIIGAKTIQILLMREILDYTVLRTEETRELNTVATPLSVSDDKTAMRVAFLATKQKAAESRQLEQMLRTATAETGVSGTECYLKDNLCLECPRCALFGATSVESGRGKDRANIKHRIEYSTAFSLLPFEDIESATTFNAINDRNQTTGQALGTRYAVIPATVFPSIISLRSVTLTEFILTIKTLLACKAYGAESRIGGDVRNTIFGIVGGWEEVITPLELTLELYDQRNNLDGDTFKAIAEKYKPLAGNSYRVAIFEPNQVDEIVKIASETQLDKEFLEKAYADVKVYVDVQKEKK